MTNDEAIVLHLEKIAAEAKITAELIKNRKHWPGEVQEHLLSIGNDLAEAKRYAGPDRHT